MNPAKCLRIEDDDNGHSVKLFSMPSHYEGAVDRVIISAGLIQDRIEKLAMEICKDFQGSERLILLCVLKGGYRFFTDLSDKIQTIGRNSEKSIPLCMEFVRLSSYSNSESTGAVQVVGVNDLSQLTNGNVLVVEDIIDTGLTMVKLLDVLKEYQPKCVKVASLLVKRTVRSNGYKPDYTGFEVPDHFLVGYALDYNDHFRDLSHICILNDHGKKKYAK